MSCFLRNIRVWDNSVTRGVLSYRCTFLSSNVGGIDSQTIYALATGGIRCALAVIRVSGPAAGEILQKMGKFRSFRDIEPRKAILRRLYDPKRGKVIDHGLALWFPGPRSFTGEDSCEFHVHGGPAVVAGVLKAIGSFPECRMAGPGEFSKRGFLNGKMDLTAVEGLNDLITAETEMQRAQAFSQMSGTLGSLYLSWRDRIAKCVASAEAFIDFGEDQNIESDVMENVDGEVQNILCEMEEHVSDKKKGEILRNGVRIAILGRPNVGKSSLLNLLSKRDAAIVSSIPGTTRDIVETCIDLKGYPIIFADTAGIRSSSDEIEKEGIRRAFLEARKADIILLIMSYENIHEKLPHIQMRVPNDKQAAKHQIIRSEFLEIVSENVIPAQDVDEDEFLGKVLLVLNKVDLEFQLQELSDDSVAKVKSSSSISENVFDGSISCKNRHGLDHLTESLAQKVAKICYDPRNESPCLTRERHRSHLKNCIVSLKNYLEPGDLDEQDLALRVQNLKMAMNSIGYITGHLGTEDILDIIFKDFCIGK